VKGINFTLKDIIIYLKPFLPLCLVLVGSPVNLTTEELSRIMQNISRRLGIVPLRLLSSQSRSYSVYPKYYIHPIYRPSDREALSTTGELQKLEFVPVLPPNNDHNASAWHDPLVAKFINYVMRMGNKKLARELVEKSFETMKKVQLEKYYKTTNAVERENIVIDPYAIFHAAVQNAKPFLQTTPVKRGGATYQVPVPISENRRIFLAMKWLIEAGKTKDDDMRFYKKLAYEFIEAANNMGQVIKRKQELHKLCEANRAYAHYRWG